tara:strand:+ start:210 stop:962 length:753 start_codon:yes stop_codon:yes gene_type:complete
MLKKYIKKILNKLGIEVRIKPKFGKVLNFDDIYKSKINKKNEIIFDVGANRGQSINRFLEINKHLIIHAFEPNPVEYQFTKEKFSEYKNIFLNNIGISEKKEKMDLNVTINSGNSSFYKIKKNTEWIKIRSNQFNTNQDNFVKEIIKVNCDTLDNYCSLNKIDQISLLKIDTQGFEDKVLNGAKNLIQNKIVKFIELEVMLDEVYDKTMTFHEIETQLRNNYKLYGIDYQGFKNLSEGYMFAVDVLYIRK